MVIRSSNLIPVMALGHSQYSVCRYTAQVENLLEIEQVGFIFTGSYFTVKSLLINYSTATSQGRAHPVSQVETANCQTNHRFALVHNGSKFTSCRSVIVY